MRDEQDYLDKRCPFCGSKYTIPYGDFIKLAKEIIQHRKCMSCEQCYRER